MWPRQSAIPRTHVPGSRWPARSLPPGDGPMDAPVVVPGVSGAPDATREQLLRRIAVSQRVVERAARAIAGHESEPCPLDHPIIGRLRCGEWLLYSGVHDLMHLEQLGQLEEALR